MKTYLLRTLVIAGALVLGLAGILTAEFLLARRGAHLEPFPQDQLDGHIGTGSVPALRVVWIGDSTGDGVGASSPDHVLSRVVARGLDRPVELTVLAHSGARVSDAIESQLPRLGELRPDWVIVAIGSNDVVHLTQRARFRRLLGELLDGVAGQHPQHIIVLGPGQFAATPRFAQPLRFITGTRARTIDADVRAVAHAHDALFVDIITRVGRAFVDDPARYHATDKFHPNDAGYALWARATLDAVHEAGWEAV